MILKTIVHPRLSDSIVVYMRSILKDMSADQLRITERDVLFDKTAVTGPNVHHRLNADDPFTPYRHLMNRRNKFAHVLDREENYGPDTVIQRNNLIWRHSHEIVSTFFLYKQRNFYGFDHKI